MAIILPRQGSFGNTLGSALGSGLGTALQGLAEGKVQQMQQQKQLGQRSQALQALQQISPDIFGNLNQEQLGQLSQLPGESFDLVLKQLLQRPLIQTGGGDNINSLLENIVSGQQPQMDTQGLSQQPQSIEQILSAFSPQEIKRQQQPFPEFVSQQVSQPQEKSVTPQEVPVKLKKDLGSSPGAKAAFEAERLENTLKNPRLSPDQKARLREQVEKREDRLLKQQEKVDKETKPYYDSIVKEHKGAEEGNLRLGRMEELIKAGELTGPKSAAFIESVPVIGRFLKSAFFNPDSQEFDKLSKDFLKNAKQFFGSRVTDNEIKLFLQTVPTLLQSDEGKLRVIENLKLFNTVNDLKFNEAQRIINENKGYRPHNLESLVSKATKDKEKIIAEDFKRGMRENVKYVKGSSAERFKSQKDNSFFPSLFESRPYKR